MKPDNASYDSKFNAPAKAIVEDNWNKLNTQLESVPDSDKKCLTECLFRAWASGSFEVAEQLLREALEVSPRHSIAMAGLTWIHGIQEAAELQLELKTNAEQAAANAKAEEERRREEAEAARAKEAEEARLKAEQAEKEKLQKEAEAKARAEAAAAQAKAKAQAAAKAQAEAQAAAKAKAEAEAKAGERVKAEADAKAAADAEADDRIMADVEQARTAAEASRVKAEQERLEDEEAERSRVAQEACLAIKEEANRTKANKERQAMEESFANLPRTPNTLAPHTEKTTVSKSTTPKPVPTNSELATEGETQIKETVDSIAKKLRDQIESQVIDESEVSAPFVADQVVSKLSSDTCEDACETECETKHEVADVNCNNDAISDQINKPNETSKSRPVILVVDDSPTIRKLVSLTLTTEGYEVITAEDGSDALFILGGQLPDLILSDINMPKLDGYKLCRFVKKHDRTKDIPVIMLSGKDGVFDKMRGKFNGCNDFIAKPFESADLVAKVGEFLNTVSS